MAIGNYIFGLLVISLSIQTIVGQIATACAGVANGTFVRNSNSCGAYYYCENGQAHGNECPDNYLFEPVHQICHMPSYVECTGCSLYGLQNIAHPMDCTKYYQCVAGVRTLRTCGANLLFDKSIGDCNAASSIQCIKDYTQICSEYGGYVKIGDPNDCSKFYTCFQGVAYHQSCASELYFKPETASCTFPEDDDFCQGDGAIVLPVEIPMLMLRSIEKFCREHKRNCVCDTVKDKDISTTKYNVIVGENCEQMSTVISKKKSKKIAGGHQIIVPKFALLGLCSWLLAEEEEKKNRKILFFAFRCTILILSNFVILFVFYFCCCCYSMS